jgi:hypothetical protein
LVLGLFVLRIFSAVFAVFFVVMTVLTISVVLVMVIMAIAIPLIISVSAFAASSASVIPTGAVKETWSGRWNHRMSTWTVWGRSGKNTRRRRIGLGLNIPGSSDSGRGMAGASGTTRTADSAGSTLGIPVVILGVLIPVQILLHFSFKHAQGRFGRGYYGR